MALFFFDVNDGRERSIDDEGFELDGFEDARKAAVRELAQIIKDELPDGDRTGYVVTVRDGNGIPVYVATATMIGETLAVPSRFGSGPAAEAFRSSGR